MRPVLFFASFLLMLAPAGEIRAHGDVEPITIHVEEGGSNESGPLLRSPIPMICEYYSVTSAIDVTFLVDLGFVSVEIENQTTGEYTQTVVNALAGTMLFPISGTAGLWTITFTLSSGVQYYGTFNI